MTKGALLASAKTTPRKAPAAKREAEKKAPVAEFRGLELELPESLPASLAFDLFGLGASSDASAQLRFLNTVLGLQQLEQIRAKLDEEGATFDQTDDILEELIGAVLGAYGTSAGESQASATS